MKNKLILLFLTIFLISIVYAVPTVDYIDPTPPNNLKTPNVDFTLNVTGSDADFDTGILKLTSPVTLDLAMTCSGTEPYYCYYESIGSAESLYTYYVLVNNTLGEENQTVERNLTIDTTAPSVSIDSPSDGAYLDYSQVNMTFSASDAIAGLDSCWWSNNSGETNYSVDCSTGEINGYNFTEGTHVIIFYANDSAGNIGATAPLTFYTDLNNPTLTIYSPIEINYDSNESVLINYTTSDLFVNECSYDLDGAGAVVVTCNESFTINVSEDTTHNLKISVTDLALRSTTKEVNFTTYVLHPEITLLSPSPGLVFNSPYSENQNVTFSFLPIDSVGLDTCQLWGDWGGTWHLNQTLTPAVNSSINSFSPVSLGDGIYFWNVLCNNSNDDSSWGNPISNQTFRVLFYSYPNYGNPSAGTSTLTEEQDTTSTLLTSINQTEQPKTLKDYLSKIIEFLKENLIIVGGFFVVIYFITNMR